MIKMYRMYRDDVEITDKKHGLVLKSQNGKRWRIKVNNSGELYTEEVVFGEGSKK